MPYILLNHWKRINWQNFKEKKMRYTGFVISVKDINASKKFYEELFDLEVYQDYGINITFDCGLSLQQDFDWLINIEKEEDY